jgi:SHS2 domain-containing protein
MYKTIEHTADVGISVEAPSLPELFTEAARAMFELMVTSRRGYIPSIEVPIEVEAPSLDQLMVRWLSELLFIFESRRLVLSKFWIDEMDEGRLVGSAKGLKFDDTRHSQAMMIKAVTYHRIRVERDASGAWRAEIIFDI